MAFRPPTALQRRMEPSNIGSRPGGCELRPDVVHATSLLSETMAEAPETPAYLHGLKPGSLRRATLCHVGDRFKMHDGTARVHRSGQDLLVLGRVGSFAEQVVVPAEQVVPVRRDVPM